MLASSEHVATDNETHLFSQYLVSQFETWDRLKRSVRKVGLNHMMEEGEFLALLRHFADAVMSRIPCQSVRTLRLFSRRRQNTFTIGARYWKSIRKRTFFFRSRPQSRRSFHASRQPGMGKGLGTVKCHRQLHAMEVVRQGRPTNKGNRHAMSFRCDMKI